MLTGTYTGMKERAQQWVSETPTSVTPASDYDIDSTALKMVVVDNDVTAFAVSVGEQTCGGQVVDGASSTVGVAECVSEVCTDTIVGLASDNGGACFSAGHG